MFGEDAVRRPMQPSGLTRYFRARGRSSICYLLSAICYCRTSL